MVAKLNLTPKDGLKQAIGILQSNNINLVGLAINASSTKNNEYYRYLKKDYVLAS
jgi:Mrp family chromosome partitioning ATPase